MAATAATNVPPQNESKGGRKKKTKAEGATKISSETAASEEGKEVDQTAVNGTEGLTDSPFLRELTK